MKSDSSVYEIKEVRREPAGGIAVGKHVAIIGNCQVDGIAAAIGAHNPEISVTAVEAPTLLTQEGRSAARARIASADTVLAMELLPSTGEFALDRITTTFPGVTMIPTIAFEGHFPDLIYLDTPARHYMTMVGQYHSRILLAGFLSGRSPRQTEALFNPMVYAKLGYFERFGESLAELESYLRVNGHHLHREVEQWRARGCFMYSSNHPKPYVIADLARYAMRKAGIAIRAEPDPIGIADTFAHLPRFPVYPEIAQRLGFEGSLDFVGPDGQFDLSSLVDGTYDIYSRLPRHVLMCRPVREALTLLTI